MEATSRDGVTLWWDASGVGDPVVLVPGRGDSSDLYPDRFGEVLVAQGLRVIRFDPRDTGASDDGGDEYTVGDMADDVLTVLNAAGVDAAHLVGLSMAGLLLVDLASRAPERVLSLTFLSCASPDPDAGVGEDFFEMMGDDPLTTIVGAMGRPCSAADREWVASEVAKSERRAPLRPEAGQRHQEAVYRSEFPAMERLAEITARTLVIHGDGDRKLPLAHGRAFVDGIAVSELVVMPSMGHLPRPAEWDSIAGLVAAHITGSKRTTAI